VPSQSALKQGERHTRFKSRWQKQRWRVAVLAKIEGSIDPGQVIGITDNDYPEEVDVQARLSTTWFVPCWPPNRDAAQQRELVIIANKAAAEESSRCLTKGTDPYGK
jgi:hypothetical protein